MFVLATLHLIILGFNLLVESEAIKSCCKDVKMSSKLTKKNFVQVKTVLFVALQFYVIGLLQEHY